MDSSQIAMHELIAFLLVAKAHTYAAEDRDAAAPPLLPGSHRLVYRQEPWLYEDNYFGGVYFVGQETVYHREQPVWSMAYAGGDVTCAASPPDMGPVYELLRAALRGVPAESPYRGPELLQRGEYVYRNEPQGDATRFWGQETILRQGQVIYALRYAGGLIR
jgi:hypothetical protein